MTAVECLRSADPIEDEEEEEILLNAPKERTKMTIDDKFIERADAWTQGIREFAPRAYRRAHALCGYPYKAYDEKSIEHFLPCYLMPLSGPLDLQNPREVFRMVSCIQYETDKEVLSDDTDAWATPRFFLDIKKGDEEDHAILLCNLFLGLSIDAYVCIGHGKVVAVDEFTDEETIQATDEQHVWVMTRPADGSIVFWECMKTKDYPLLKRWKGEDGDDDETDEEDEANNQEDEGDDDDDMKFSAFYEDDIMLKDNQIHAPDIFMDDQGMMGRRDDDSSGEEEDLFLVKPNVIPPYHSIHIVFNHENIWANMQSLDPTVSGSLSIYLTTKI